MLRNALDSPPVPWLAVGMAGLAGNATNVRRAIEESCSLRRNYLADLRHFKTF